MSNGQEEIARLEAATDAFNQIITTENDSVDVPNIGDTPSLKKRVDDRLDGLNLDSITHMQSSPSDVDEYGYPLRTLYKNGDGMIVYYPEYSVFRKDGGGWKRIDPHVRNVVNFNGTTQYAAAHRVAEIDLDDSNLEFEFEWNCYLDSESKSMDVLNHSNVKGITNNELRVRYFTSSGEYRLYLYVGGSNTVLALVSGFGWHNYRVTYNKSTSLAKCWIDDVYQGQKSLSVGVHREPDANLMIGALDNGGTLQDFFAGEISDLRIWTGGDRNTGVLTRDYRMDEGWRTSGKQLLVNYATELGAELILPEWQNFDTTPIGQPDNTYYSEIASGEVRGVDYLFSFDVSNYSGNDSMGMLSGNYFKPFITVSSNAAKREILVRVGTSGAGLFNRSTNQGTFENVTMKQADGYGEYKGTTEASWTQETV